jgi:hypothetical protein
MIQEEVEAFERFELLEDADYDLPGSPELGDTVSFGAAPKTPLTPFQSLQEQEPINGLGGLRVSPLLRYRIK